jgi:hypothetical protein
MKKVVASRQSALFCFPDSCLTFLTADADRECRRRARLAWRVGENEESEVQDSTGIRRQAKNQPRERNEVNRRPG